MEFDRYSVALLILRDDAHVFSEEEENDLQNARMAHLADLHEEGRLLVAGPLLDQNEKFRGLSILKVDVERARELKERDPAVRAGRYSITVLPWMVPSGAMNFTAARFPRSLEDVRS